MSARPMRDRTTMDWCDRAPSAQGIAATIVGMPAPLQDAEGTPFSVNHHGEAA